MISETGQTWDLSVLDSAELAPDALERGVLAQTIARGLARSRPAESLITAIYGPWGSGKTWLKSRILQELKDQAAAVTIIEFSPWQIRGVDELTIKFFAQIHGHLIPESGSPSDKMVKRERMWMALARLSGAGGAAMKIVGNAAALSDQGQAFAPALMAAAGVSEHFATLLQKAATDIHVREETHRLPANPDEARAELGKLFSEPNLPSLLVVIDDFDWLTSDEIQTLVRLIKANANFPGLNYLIFCDEEQLAAALNPITANKGREFLEKIVQNPIRLPMPDSNAILNQLTAGLRNIAARVSYPLDQYSDRLQAYFRNFLYLRLKNLRSVYRLLEALEFSTSALTRAAKLEVDLLDLLAVDFLRLYASPLSDCLQVIRPSSYLFVGLRRLPRRGEEEPFERMLPSEVTQLFGIQNTYSILRTLFPQMGEVFPAAEALFDRSFSNLSTFSKNYPLALSEDEHFDAYFRLQPSILKIPESAYMAVTASDLNRKDLKQHFSDWISNGWLNSGVRRLGAERETFSESKKTEIALALADCSDSVGANDDAVALEGEFRSAMSLMYLLLKELPQEKRYALIEKVFESVDAVTARLMLLEDLRIRSAPERWKGHRPRSELPIIAQESLNELRATLAAAANKAIRDRSYFDHRKQTTRIWRWANALGEEYTERFLRERLDQNDLDVIFTVLRGVARSKAGSYDMSFEDSTAYAGSRSDSFLQDLLRFGAMEFWRDFVSACAPNFPQTEMPRDGDDCLIQHVRRALESLNNI